MKKWFATLALLGLFLANQDGCPAATFLLDSRATRRRHYEPASHKLVDRKQLNEGAKIPEGLPCANRKGRRKGY
jgi:hypothetical protein